MTPSRHMRRTGQNGGTSAPDARRNAPTSSGKSENRHRPARSKARPRTAGRRDAAYRSRPGAAPRGRLFRGECPPAFGGLFSTLLCTIKPLSDESLASPCRGANVFWGLRAIAAIRTQFERGVGRGRTRLTDGLCGVIPERALSEPICSGQCRTPIAFGRRGRKARLHRQAWMPQTPELPSD